MVCVVQHRCLFANCGCYLQEGEMNILRVLKIISNKFIGMLPLVLPGIYILLHRGTEHLYDSRNPILFSPLSCVLDCAV